MEARAAELRKNDRERRREPRVTCIGMYGSARKEPHRNTRRKNAAGIKRDKDGKNKVNDNAPCRDFTMQRYTKRLARIS